MSRQNIIAVDFDGTLFRDAWPGIGEPIWENIQRAKRAKEGGAFLILWTCRHGEKLEEAIVACRKVGLDFDAVNDNHPDITALFGAGGKKITADEYWDDHAVHTSAHTAKRERILHEALTQFGYDRQVDKAIEEMTELTTALIRHRQAMRYGRGNKNDALVNILEEMADVQITLDQMKLAFGDTAEVEAVKLKALEHKIQREKEGNT